MGIEHKPPFLRPHQNRSCMKKNVLIFGLISGLLITAMMLVTATMCYNNPEFVGNDIMGYTAMIIAFSFIFIGIKNYRDKYLQGTITFGQAFKTGFFITLIASTMYVLVWLVYYYLFIPDFVERYAAHVLRAAENKGATPVELGKKAKEMADFKEMYKSPFFVVIMTFFVVLPVGLVVSLISALILKRKAKEQTITQ
jgi:hypothetical protein